MASMKGIVADARSAATRQWSRARAAFAAQDADALAPVALARIIEADMIPRLLADVPARTALPATPVPAGFADQFAAAALAEDVAALLARLEALMVAGVPVERVYLDVLAPAARRLGAWWDDDEADFVDVTMGLWRCQELVHALGALVPGRAAPDGKLRAALFAPAPGEQHVLGALIVEEFFRRDGWDTYSLPALHADELVALVAGRRFDLVGLSLSGDRHVAGLARTIAALRRVSRQADMRVLVGGRVINLRPALAMELGADGTASDGPGALALANEWMAARETVAS
jgi:methanogenic corrinoid protein MtbC1